MKIGHHTNEEEYDHRKYNEQDPEENKGWNK